MIVEFLSVDSWRPNAIEEDTVSLLINGHVQIDTGWHCVRNLLRAGKTPKDVDLLLFSHMHQDHYLSLPQFLFYLLNSFHDASSVTIRGPERLEEVVEQSLTLSGKHIHYTDCPGPNVAPLRTGDSFEWGALRIDVHESHHAAPGLCYRITDMQEGTSFVYTGDTFSTEDIAEFARGCDVLIHESARGAAAPEGDDNVYAHSTAQQAAHCAVQAGVKQLYLVHTEATVRADCLAAARAIFPKTYAPMANERVII